VNPAARCLVQPTYIPSVEIVVCATQIVILAQQARSVGPD